MKRKRVSKMTGNWDRFDINKNGDMTVEEIHLAKDILELELKEEKANAQRKMAWFSIISLVGYGLLPLIPIVSEARLDAVLSMSDTLFIALASIVGFYFGATAYMSRKGS